MRRRAAVLWVIGGLVAAAAAWVRLAPADPARWHADPVTAAAPDCTLRAERASARLACLLPGDPQSVLERLAAAAAAAARTRVLAGAAADGRITWETRSRLWGFPDYTTAAVAAAGDGRTRLDLHARSRFGGFDWGVNAARLAAWTRGLPR